MIIEDKIILELKSIPTEFHPAHYLQLISYLKCWQKELGLLVNFGLPRVAIQRLPFTEKKPVLIERLANDLKVVLNQREQQLLKELKTIFSIILNQHGVGYGASIYKALLMEELAFRKIHFSPQTIIPIMYEGSNLKNFELKQPLINENFICYVSALQEGVSNDVSKLKNYLKTLKLKAGLVAHFGKEKLEIIEVANPTFF